MRQFAGSLMSFQFGTAIASLIAFSAVLPSLTLGLMPEGIGGGEWPSVAPGGFHFAATAANAAWTAIWASAPAAGAGPGARVAGEAGAGAAGGFVGAGAGAAVDAKATDRLLLLASGGVGGRAAAAAAAGGDWKVEGGDCCQRDWRGVAGSWACTSASISSRSSALNFCWPCSERRSGWR